MSTLGDLDRWVAYLFDHPVTKPAWHWAPNAPEWDDDDKAPMLIAELFEDSGRLLAPFSDEQLNQGLWLLVCGSCSNFMHTLVHDGVPLGARLRAVRSFVPLFEQVMATRCSQSLSHFDERGVGPLNSICYMWWDVLPICGSPTDPTRALFDGEVMSVLGRLLAIPHNACRESALHGIGHWVLHYPEVAATVERFIATTPGLRSDLIEYARLAQKGLVQ